MLQGLMLERMSITDTVHHPVFLLPSEAVFCDPTHEYFFDETLLFTSGELHKDHSCLVFIEVNR